MQSGQRLALACFIRFAVLFSAASGVGAADRPQWGERFSRNMVSPETGLPAKIDPGDAAGLRWVARLGTQTWSTPVVSSGKVLIGTNNDEPRDGRHKGDRGVMLCLDEKDGSLAEISLQTDSLSSISYDDTIKDTWSQLIELLTALHGNPVQSAPYPASNQILPDTIIGSHIWKLEKGGTAMLGISRSEQKFLVVVRFSKKTIDELQKFQIKSE